VEEVDDEKEEGRRMRKNKAREGWTALAALLQAT